MKNAILTYATNITLNEFTRLVASIRRFMPADVVDVFVFTDIISPEAARLATKLNVRLVRATSIWSQVQSSLFLRILFRLLFECIEWSEKMLPPSTKRRHVLEVLTAIWSHPITARHHTYVQFLEQNPNYGLVMLTDARDVVFQGDAFKGMEKGVIHAFLQDESLIYGDHNVDTDWYRGMYGEKGIKAIAGKYIACAGTVYGDVNSLLALERALFDEIVRLKRGAIDQAIFNMLINQESQNFQTKLHPNLHSNVLTFGEVPDEKFQVVGGEVRVGSHIPAVLHQFDRVAAVNEMLSCDLLIHQASIN
jgi:hypothetical protein